MDPKREEDSAGYRVVVLHVLQCYHGENVCKPTLDFTRLKSLAQASTPDEGGQTFLLSERVREGEDGGSHEQIQTRRHFWERKWQKLSQPARPSTWWLH